MMAHRVDQNIKQIEKNEYDTEFTDYCGPYFSAHMVESTLHSCQHPDEMKYHTSVLCDQNWTSPITEKWDNKLSERPIGP